MENRRRRRNEKELRRDKKKLNSEIPKMLFKYQVNQLQGLGPIINTYITITDSHKKLFNNPDRQYQNLLNVDF